MHNSKPPAFLLRMKSRNRIAFGAKLSMKTCDVPRVNTRSPKKTSSALVRRKASNVPTDTSAIVGHVSKRTKWLYSRAQSTDWQATTRTLQTVATRCLSVESWNSKSVMSSILSLQQLRLNTCLGIRLNRTRTIHFEIVDNRKRKDPLVEVDIHLDFETVHIEVQPHPTQKYTYELTWSHDYSQIGILNIFFDGEQIPQSPVRVQVVERRCDLDFPGQKRTAAADGSCNCGEGTWEIRGKCVESTIMAIVISIAAVILISIIGFCYVSYRNHKNDEMWQVSIEEL